jgi:hypothetical protein
VNGKPVTPDSPGDGELGEQLIRLLRAEDPGCPALDAGHALARFRCGLARMRTDPEYAAYISRLAADAGKPRRDRVRRGAPQAIRRRIAWSGPGILPRRPPGGRTGGAG